MGVRRRRHRILPTGPNSQATNQNDQRRKGRPREGREGTHLILSDGASGEEEGGALGGLLPEGTGRQLLQGLRGRRAPVSCQLLGDHLSDVPSAVECDDSVKEIPEVGSEKMR